jgi:hypothetical protein
LLARRDGIQASSLLTKPDPQGFQLLLQLEHMLLLRSQGSIQSANSVFHKRQFRFQFRSIAHQEFFVMAAPDGC